VEKEPSKKKVSWRVSKLAELASVTDVVN